MVSLNSLSLHPFKEFSSPEENCDVDVDVPTTGRAFVSLTKVAVRPPPGDCLPAPSSGHKKFLYSLKTDQYRR